MTNDVVIFRLRVRTLALAQEVRVRAACRAMGIHRSTYYRWKHLADRYGLELLRPYEWRMPCMPNATPPHIGQKILAFSLAHPGCGPQRIRQRGDIILFIDELHTLVGAGAAEGAIDAASILKPMLTRGELQTIGATTLAEYRKHLEKDAALERRFQPIQVEEPSVTETIEILKGLREGYEQHHRVVITDEGIVAAANLADRYITDRFLPDKAIDLIDESGSRMRLRKLSKPPELKELDDRISLLKTEMDAAVEQQDFSRAQELKGQVQTLTRERREREEAWRSDEGEFYGVIGEEEVAEVLAAWTGIPVHRLTEEESAKLLRMEEELHRSCVSQDEAVKAVSRAIRRTRAGLKDPKRPSGSFIFLGPSGVGKTKLAKTLAEFLLGDEDALIQIDMSEYIEKHPRYLRVRRIWL